MIAVGSTLLGAECDCTGSFVDDRAFVAVLFTVVVIGSVVAPLLRRRRAAGRTAAQPTAEEWAS